MPVIATALSWTSISMSPFLNPGISAFNKYSFSPSFKSTAGTRISGIKENVLVQFAGKRRSSKSLLNLENVSSNACQISDGVAGAKLDAFLEGLLTTIGSFFFFAAVSISLGDSFTFTMGFFSAIKTRQKTLCCSSLLRVCDCRKTTTNTQNWLIQFAVCFILRRARAISLAQVISSFSKRADKQVRKLVWSIVF